ncbi:MAG: hypothetical protein ACYDBB_02815 [Armatimonadota bacterium]
MGETRYYRNANAKDAMKRVLSYYGKGEFEPALGKLAEIEANIASLAPGHRNHISHSLLVYMLGTMVNDEFLRWRHSSVNHLAWTVASLLHDIGYPVEIAHEYILKGFSASIPLPVINRNDDECAQLFRVVPYELEMLSCEINSLAIFDERFQKWGVGVISAADQYKRMVDSGKVRHGMISAVLVLKVIDSLYRENAYWDPRTFHSDIIDACAAIFLHNVYSDCFTPDVKLHHDIAPLAFLLTLCDCMQEWDRYTEKDNRNLPASFFQLRVDGSGVILFVPNESTRSKVRDDCAKRLCMDCVDIRLSTDAL